MTTEIREEFENIYYDNNCILNSNDYQFNRIQFIKRKNMFSEDFNNEDKITFEVCVINPENNQCNYFTALLDTGSTFTGISPKVKEILNLKPSKGTYNYTDVEGNIKETSICNIYLNIIKVNYMFKIESAVTPTIYDFCDVIIGMDVIKQCNLKLEKGQFTLGY
ncbi:hypothetical protein [Winogradskyella forsetii]|uniref:hypothetical protein n=1 Tax=Winogradskyella forsetii TaxID=2686077 RepID=UPI0015B8C40E|nr:hypothetical protein [Winogradskyella forsetii]